MRRADWTPAVLITASVAITAVIGILLTGPWIRGAFEPRPEPPRPRRALGEQVDTWVGELAPGLLGVLAPVWGEAASDREHDERLNEGLALRDHDGLAWYRLLLFNTSEETRTLVLGDGALRIRPADGSASVALRSVPALRARGVVSLTPALETVLGARGTLAEEVEVPAGWMVDLLVAFDRRVDLEQAVEVASDAGAAFHRRRMERGDLDRLLEDPDAARLQDLW